MKNIDLISLITGFILLTVFPAGASTTLSGCDGGDFDADCSLAELNAGGHVQIDNILFDNWQVNLNQGSLNTILVTAIDEGSASPGPGLNFKGPGLTSNETVGLEINYDVSQTGGTPLLEGYRVAIGFEQPSGTAGGFAAMEITDNVLLDSSSTALEIANPEPTVDQNDPVRTDDFTTCDNNLTITCPSDPEPTLPRVKSSDLRVTTNMEVGGGANGELDSFDLSQRFALAKTGLTSSTGCDGSDFGPDCSLAELEAGGAIQVGDFLFDNWNASAFLGSLNQIRVTAITDDAPDFRSGPGPGLRFDGPGAASNQSTGLEMHYDVSHIDGAPLFTGYNLRIDFNQNTGTAGGFAAMEVTDNFLDDTAGVDLEIANPEPTVDQVTPALSDRFTSCDNGLTATCPATIDTTLPAVISAGFTVTTNLDVGGGTSGSYSFFYLTQHFALKSNSALCFPVNGRNAKIAVICL